MLEMSAWRTRWFSRAAVAALLLGVAAASGLMALESSDASSQAEQLAREASTRHARIIDGKTVGAKRALEAMARRWDKSREERAGALTPALAARFLEREGSLDDASGFSVANESGRVIADYPPLPGRSGQDISKRDYFKRAIGEGGFAIQAPIFSRNRGAFIGIAAQALRGADGKIEAVLLATIRLDHGDFVDALEADARAAGVWTSWSDAHGRAIWSYKPPEMEKASARSIKEATAVVPGSQWERIFWAFLSAFGSSLALTMLAAKTFANDLRPSLKSLRRLGVGDAQADLDWTGLGALGESLERAKQALEGQQKVQRESDEIFEAFGQATGMGVFVCGPRGEIVKSNGKFATMSGRAQFLGDLAQGSEREQLLEHFQAASSGLGKVRWEGWAGEEGAKARWALALMPLAGSNPARYLGAAQDVSEKSRLEMRLIFERDKAERMMEAVNEAVLYLDTYGHVERASAGMLELLGKKSADVRGMWVGRVVKLADRYDGMEAPIEEMLTQDRVDSDRWMVERGTGVLSPVELRWRKLREESMEGVLSLSDISARVEEIEKIRWEAHHDALTGLLNRRAFGLAVEELQIKMAREHAPCSVLLLDLDGFKDVNDRFGHEVGDKMLKLASQTLSSMASPFDFVARLGGDEFAVAMQGVDANEARIRAHEMREAIACAAVQTDQGLATVGVSIGVAQLGADDPKAQAALREADQEMYVFKNNAKQALCRLPRGPVE
jgi:diguanylate cyclase (GGDEF)-like protein